MKSSFVHHYNNPISWSCLLCMFLLLISISVTAQNFTKLSYAELDSLVLETEAGGDLEGCIPYLKTAMNKAKAEFGEIDSTYAKYVSDLGYFYGITGQEKEAINYHILAADISAKVFGAEDPTAVDNLYNLAYLYKNLGYYEQSEALHLKVKSIRSKILGEEDPNFATSLNDLGLLYDEIGYYDKAEPLLLQAKSIWAKILGEQHLHYAVVLNNLAGVYRNMGDYEKAEQFSLQAKDIYTINFGEGHINSTPTLNNLGNLYREQKQYEKAEILLLQIKKIREKTLGPLVKTNLSFAIGLNNLALLYQDMGKYNQAEELYMQSKTIRKEVLGKEHFLVSNSLNTLASLYQKMNRLDTALNYCFQSIDANSAQIDSSFSDWANLDKYEYYSNNHINKSITGILSILQNQYDKTGDKTKLEFHYKIAQAAMRLNERIRNDFSSEGDKLRNLATTSEFVLQGIKTATLLGKDPQESFAFAELNKGVLLMDAIKAEKVYKFGNLPDSLANEEKLLQKKYSDLQASLLEKRPQEEIDHLRKLLNDLNHEIDVFTKKMKTQYPKYSAVKYENKSTKASDIQAVLDDKTALFEYVISDSVVYVFCVTKQNVRLEEVAIGHTILLERIKKLHRALSDYVHIVKEEDLAYKEYTEMAYWFYENLLKPTLSKAKGIEKLIIISDGELGHLPFEAFLVESAPQKEIEYKELHYLVNDYQISYNYSATLWRENKTSQHKTNNGQLFAMAANYGTKTQSDSRLPYYQRLREGLMELPAARKEVEILAETFSGFFAFDKDASEKEFKEKAGAYGVIHLAMHGLLDNKNQILSSLAFTEDGDSLENNFLQAYEISKMQLNADLVVLSACETGYGKFEKGNGIASLARAFMYAGAPAMVVSLWQVNDYATSEMMKNLYQNLADGMEKDEALQQAKMKYLRDAQGIAAHPAFWSPFVLMGNTDGITLGQTHMFAPTWAIIGISLALFGGIAFAIRRKRKE